MRQSAQDTPLGAARSSIERSELALPSVRHAPARMVHFGPRSELSVRLKSSLNRTPFCGGGPASGTPASAGGGGGGGNGAALGVGANTSATLPPVLALGVLP